MTRWISTILALLLTSGVAHAAGPMEIFSEALMAGKMEAALFDMDELRESTCVAFDAQKRALVCVIFARQGEEMRWSVVIHGAKGELARHAVATLTEYEEAVPAAGLAKANAVLRGYAWQPVHPLLEVPGPKGALGPVAVGSGGEVRVVDGEIQWHQGDAVKACTALSRDADSAAWWVYEGGEELFVLRSWRRGDSEGAEVQLLVAGGCGKGASPSPAP